MELVLACCTLAHRENKNFTAVYETVKSTIVRGEATNEYNHTTDPAFASHTTCSEEGSRNHHLFLDH